KTRQTSLSRCKSIQFSSTVQVYQYESSKQSTMEDRQEPMAKTQSLPRPWSLPATFRQPESSITESRPQSLPQSLSLQFTEQKLQRQRKARRRTTPIKFKKAELIKNLTSHQKNCFFNLAQITLTPFQALALSLSLKHIPTAPVHNLKINLRESVKQFQRRLKIKLHFAMDDQLQNKIYPRIIGNTWEPTDSKKIWLKYIDDWHCNINNTIGRIAFAKTKQLNYIDKEILKALNQLANMHNIVIKPADKNLGPVILTRRQYEMMCMEHLSNSNTYEITNNFDPNKCYIDLESIIEKHNMRYVQYANNSNKRQKRETQLARSICQLKNSPLLRGAYFYCNPKMHKPGLVKKGRPIVSSINSVTYHT